MANYKIGFIGFGNMAKAIAKGFIEKNTVKADDICFFDPSVENGSLGATKIANNIELANVSKFIILAVKPNMVDFVVNEIKDSVQNKPIASIAAGITSDYLESKLPDCRLLLIMPNTGAQIGRSYTCFNLENTFSGEELTYFNEIFTSIGKVQLINEKYFNVAASVASCGVAFGHLLIESMADGGLLCGLPKNQAIEMASWAVLAACETILITGSNPGVLKDQITSPGGMTAAALKALEDGCFRGNVMEAIQAATDKGDSLK